MKYMHIVSREVTLILSESCLFPLNENKTICFLLGGNTCQNYFSVFWKGIYSKRKEFAHHLFFRRGLVCRKAASLVQIAATTTKCVHSCQALTFGFELTVMVRSDDKTIALGPTSLLCIFRFSHLEILRSGKQMIPERQIAAPAR